MPLYAHPWGSRSGFPDEVPQELHGPIAVLELGRVKCSVWELPASAAWHRLSYVAMREPQLCNRTRECSAVAFSAYKVWESAETLDLASFVTHHG